MFILLIPPSRLLFHFNCFICPVAELAAGALAQQKAEAETHAVVNSYMQSFYEGELRQLKVKFDQYSAAEAQYLHDATKLFKLRQDSDPEKLQKYSTVGFAIQIVGFVG